jgi:hypothetical protein
VWKSEDNRAAAIGKHPVLLAGGHGKFFSKISLVLHRAIALG